MIELRLPGQSRRDVNYGRRQKYRRLIRAGCAGLTSAAAVAVALFVIAAGATVPGVVLLIVAAMLGLRARHWLWLAGRRAVGARSEDEVRRALAALEEQGWRLLHGVRWRGGGDIDSVAIALSGHGFRSRRRPERTMSGSWSVWSSRLA